ncbi:unnamed protein product [Parascedosporium putredinis]|uniref:Endo-beta-1,6-galactanase-like domain-containing protein n=1 Tax=Parascedosporium putredinis TaxID=1442378 RepID=A0A9P1GX16_9PEZI|nr:unnamed protein product [Parascedosporium putredinis]CAI7988611.1 unnamed protein product [Parascedosporium putredinis]
MRFTDISLAVLAAQPAAAGPVQWAKRQFGGFPGGGGGGAVSGDITVNLGQTFQRWTGAGFSILRNGIGSSLSSDSDWMNTFAPDNPGSPTAEPTYKWDGKDSGQLWVAKTAQEKYGLKYVYGNAWSPPFYMKSNNNENNGGNLKTEWYQAYANYLVQYVKFYAQEGVNITHLGPMNEPDFSASYASALWDGNSAANFIKVLQPTIERKA